jgi:hypothetical protein
LSGRRFDAREPAAKLAQRNQGNIVRPRRPASTVSVEAGVRETIVMTRQKKPDLREIRL